MIKFLIFLSAVTAVVLLAIFSDRGGSSTVTFKPSTVYTQKTAVANKQGRPVVRGNVGDAINLGLYPTEEVYAPSHYRAYGEPVDATTRLEYRSADRSRDGTLQATEIIDFVEKWDSKFNYYINDWALTPTEFMESETGDCEDFATFTADFLRFWDIPAYVGVVQSEEGNHAVTLMRVARPDNRFLCFYVGEGTYVDEGYYIPIDYGTVGSFTSAVGNDWYMLDVFTVERIYGLSF
jgi:transglutaminase-like putative cysteine protease